MKIKREKFHEQTAIWLNVEKIKEWEEENKNPINWHLENKRKEMEMEMEIGLHCICMCILKWWRKKNHLNLSIALSLWYILFSFVESWPFFLYCVLLYFLVERHWRARSCCGIVISSCGSILWFFFPSSSFSFRSEEYCIEMVEVTITFYEIPSMTAMYTLYTSCTSPPNGQAFKIVS